MTEPTAEEKKAIIAIELSLMQINKAQMAYQNIFARRSEFNRILDRETGYQQKKAMQLARIMQHYLPIVIRNKKIINASWGPDQKVLESVNKMFEHIN